MSIDWGRIGADVFTGGGYELARAGYNALVKPGQQAAQQAANNQQQLSQQAFGLAPQLQNQANQIGQQALGYYGPAQAQWNWNGQLNSPGAAENAFSQNGWQLNPYANPSQGQQYLQGAGQGMLSSSAAENWYNQNQGAYTSPTNQQNFYNQSGNQYAQNANNASNQYNQVYSNLGQVAQGFNPSNSVLQQNYQGLNNQLDTADALERASGQIQNQYNTSNYLGQNMNKLAGQYGTSTADYTNRSNQLMDAESGPSVTASQYGQLASGYAGADQSQMQYQRDQRQLNGPGMYEQFVQGALTGNDPYYQRLQQQQTANLDASMNSRGAYNSGAALYALGNQNAALAANQYENLANMAQGAQQTQLARLAQGMGAAGQASQERMAQTQGLQGLSGQTETELQNRLGAQQAISSGLFSGQQGSATNLANLYSGAGQEQQNIARGLQSLATDTSQQRLARMQEQDQLAQNTAQNYANMLTGQGNALTAQGNITQQNAAQQLAALNARQGAAAGADTSGLNLLNAGANAAQNSSAADLARLTNYGNLATNIDTGNRQALNDYFSAAQNAQNLQQSRLQTQFGDALGLGAAQAGVITGQGNVGLQAYENMIANAMGLSGNAAALNASAAQMPFQDIMSLLGLGTNMYRAASGGGAGRPG